MSLWVVVAGSATVLLIAYRTYGGFLAQRLRLDDSHPTPAETLRDDLDFSPTPSSMLLPQHFSAIAAAGPIVGPILAGAMFGWLPALLWILVGSVLIGGVHDMTSLVASVRHQARSIPEVVRDHIGKRAYLLFLAFVWLSLVYIIVAFTDVTASSFHGVLTLDNPDATETISRENPSADSGSATVTVSGAGIATSSLLYLGLPILMGLLVRWTGMSFTWATIIFLPAVGWSIWFGQGHSLDIGGWMGLDKPNTQRLWNLLILAYCFVASLAPVWILLQPRGSLGGWFLYAALFAGAVGVAYGGKEIKYPAFIGFTAANGAQLFPILFITIACGACSGFHSLIASGTTSKQLRRESDAKLVGYGCMLLEAMVAIVSLSCVMILAKGDALLSKSPNFLYAGGIGSFLNLLGLPIGMGIAFGLMAFTTFVYDTLDVCTRLGRFILQELFGWNSMGGKAMATAITTLAPIPFLLWQRVTPTGELDPVWRIFWTLFGASNQLLAALALLGVTVWLWRTYREKWVWICVAPPTAWMYTMSMWALGQTILKGFGTSAKSTDTMVASVASVLFLLGAFLLVEAIVAIDKSITPRGPQPALAGAS